VFIRVISFHQVHFSFQQHMLYCAICCGPSVCPSHGWISQKRL